MSIFAGKWDIAPQIEPPDKKTVLELIQQSKWDARLKKSIERIVSKYNEAHPEDPITFKND